MAKHWPWFRHDGKKGAVSTERQWSFHHGDGVNGLLAHGPVDHSILDPPFSKDVEDGNAAIEVRDNEFKFDAMTEDLRNRAARAIAQQTRRWALIFCSCEESHLWRFALVAAGMSYYRTGFWIREGTAPQFNGLGPAQGAEAIVIAHSRVLPQRWNGGGNPAIWHAPIVRTDRMHETQKPASLMRRLIEEFTDEGETIADPFAGVATTGIAAVGLGRRFIGWELDKDHYANGRKRLELPLFEPRAAQPTQTEIGGDSVPKGARVRARMELDRAVLNAVEAVGPDGVQASGLVELVNGTRRQIDRSLQRLQKKGAVLRQGRTSQTRWFSANHPPESHEQRRTPEDPPARRQA